MSPEIDLDKLSERARPLVETLLKQKAAAPQITVSRKIALDMLGCGLSKLLLLEASDEVQSFIEGGQRKILVASIFDRLVRQVILSYPVGQPPTKAHTVRTRFRKKPRARTPQELAGLAKGNERRRREAAERRAAGAVSMKFQSQGEAEAKPVT
jgi:hypothetical protein